MEKKPLRIGVLVCRFQVDELTEGHRDLINTVKSKYDKVLLFLGEAAVRNSRMRPLPYVARKPMVAEEFPHIEIYPLDDQYNNDLWCQLLDERIRQIYPEGDITIIGSRDSVANTYIGKFPVLELPARHHFSGRKVREAIEKSGVMSTRDFRRGMIYAAYWRYPTNYPTVDAVVLKNGGTEMLLGRKKRTPSGKWVTPGGFFDAADNSFEEAIKREVREETGLVGIGWPRYIGSAIIPDPRYEGEVDNIVTSLFVIDDFAGEVKAADDLAEVRWFSVKELLEKDGDVFVNYHRPLWELFKKYLNQKA